MVFVAIVGAGVVSVLLAIVDGISIGLLSVVFNNKGFKVVDDGFDGEPPPSNAAIGDIVKSSKS